MQQHTSISPDLHGLTGNGIRFAGGFGRIVFPFGARHHKCGGATESRGTAGLRNVGDLGAAAARCWPCHRHACRPSGQTGRRARPLRPRSGRVVGDCRAAGTCGHITGPEKRVLLKDAIFHGIGQVQTSLRRRLLLRRRQPFSRMRRISTSLPLIVGGDDDFMVSFSLRLINDQGSINPRRNALWPGSRCPVRRDRAGR